MHGTTVKKNVKITKLIFISIEEFYKIDQDITDRVVFSITNEMQLI